MSWRPDSSARWQWAALAGGVLPPFFVYLLTLAPDITWAHNGADGGDLIVAAYSLGVSHPPGYPAYTLLAHLFTLLPWGSVAFRVNLLSALGAALAAGSVALSVILLTPQKPRWSVFFSALAAAWLLAFSPFLWGQALIAEVYAPHAALTGFSLWQALRLHQRPARPAALILGLVWGISFGFQITSIFLLPILVWALRRRAPETWACLAGFALASLQWLYPVLRAGLGAVTWGDPSTLSGWAWLVSGSLYRGYLFSAPPQIWFARLLYLPRALLIDFGPFSALLALAGAVILARARPWLVAAWGASATAYIIFSLGYNTSDSDNYLLPVFLLFCLFIGLGLTELWPEVSARLGYSSLPVGLALFLALTLWSLPVNGPRLSLKTEREALQFGEDVLQAAPQNAILLSQDDRATFTLWYFLNVLHRREDVSALDVDLLAFDWYRASLKISPAQLNAILADGALTPRPVCHASPETQPFLTDCRPGR